MLSPYDAGGKKDNFKTLSRNHDRGRSTKKKSNNKRGEYEEDYFEPGGSLHGRVETKPSPVDARKKRRGTTESRKKKRSKNA